ncbi:putative 50S ribosomal protein L35, chloroplastic-like [Capsicum annuum]|nr:putative 50S ribosomal protein L35, chloroplastic-like [Capsicum annuum]
MRLSQNNASSTASSAPENPSAGSNKETRGAATSVATEKLKTSNFSGSLRRIVSGEYASRYEGDLVAKCYFAKHKLVWEILEGGLKSKIEIQWSDIMGLKASCPENGAGSLTLVPLFFKETNPQPRKHTLWQATSDFTDGQASLHRTVFENLDEVNEYGIDPVASGKGSSLSSIQDAASPVATQSSSVSFEQPDLLGAAPERLSRDAPSPSSVMDTRAVGESANSIGYDAPEMQNFEQLKVPGRRPSMSMTDLVSHIESCISQQINSGNLQCDEALECKGMLEDIAQIWLSDTQDESQLIGENHLLKPVQSNDACSSSACENKENNQENASDLAGGKPTPSIPRRDSFGDLLHLPRITSLPKFLFNIAEDDENQAR